MPNLFIDLDGTIIDARKRVYEVFRFLVPTSNLSFDAYWEIKRAGISNESILINHFNFSDLQIANFISQWMKEIEKENWLELDKPFDNIKSKLQNLKKNYKLILVTARQSTTNTLKQLKQLQLDTYFDDILITNQTLTKQVIIKQKFDVTSEDLIVGDTGKDIETGKALGIKTVAVLCGFLSASTLEKYNPDYIIQSLTDFNA
ncbi:MAG: HAD family hydrolase [Cyclobacteriaceae bacterium]|jgi:phosphoglycolate phosphatase|nr:HAD family hydrolase [Cytophagales bacterium]MCZ8327964.1 HAD family hydrolase [Cyclobacteriaceae bacterium]